MNNITFVIFTYNEEKRIERVIKNFNAYGKILIADNKSTDRTQEIARSFGCDILIRENQYVFVENQEMVDLIYNKISTDWIYWGFADEMLEKDTLDKIISTIESNKFDIIDIDRKNYFYGEFCYDLYHARTNKIFKKGAIDFRNNVIHGMGKPTVPNDKIYYLPDKYYVHHFISNTAKSYINVINNYTEYELNPNHKVNQSLLYFMYTVLKITIKGLYLNNGYKAKYKGLALAEIMLFYFTIKNMKNFENNNNLTNKTIEEKNDNYRDSILMTFNS